VFTRTAEAATNPLRADFDALKTGPGVWKWLHYFDLYHRHLQKFRGHDVSIAEVGVYSGGSLSMWRRYFGERVHIHGIDIQPECRSYANSNTTIHIGDQADRRFWADFRRSAGSLDVLIDDGGHEPEQQIVTLEEVLPFLNPGGVFICEDIAGSPNNFADYAHALASELNCYDRIASHEDQASTATPFQSSIASITCYPFVVVIEKNESPSPIFTAPRRGTQWQPFLNEVLTAEQQASDNRRGTDAVAKDIEA